MKTLSITVTVPGEGSQLVRFAQPFEDGFLQVGTDVRLMCGKEEVTHSLRILTRYPNTNCVRSALITFMQPAGTCEYTMSVGTALCPSPACAAISYEDGYFCATFKNGLVRRAKLIAPEGLPKINDSVETVESNAFCLWQRFSFERGVNSYTADIRAFADGTVLFLGLLQQVGGRDGYCPGYGWELLGDAPVFDTRNYQNRQYRCKDEDITLTDGDSRIYFPLAHAQLAGCVELNGKSVRVLRAAPSERVAIQPYAYRRCAIAVTDKAANRVDETLRFPCHVTGNEERFRLLLSEYERFVPVPDEPELREAVKNMRKAGINSCLKGDDLGNVTYIDIKTCTGMNIGINRLNHIGDYLLYGLVDGDEELLKCALLWCDNWHDLTVWWGEECYGGTRYPRISEGWGGYDIHQPPYIGTSYMWRANETVSFSHKGFAHLYTGYELTGDPALLNAALAQADYGLKYVNVEDWCTRNIGVARDFALLYNWTHKQEYLDKAIKMYRDLMQFVNADGLFDEQGMCVDGKEGFIDDDPTGYTYGYAKPYITGYGLEGLCALRRVAGNIDGLDAEILCLARYLCSTLDECGAVRYPHPSSAMTHLTLEVGQYVQRVLENVPDIPEKDRLLFEQSIEHMLKLAVFCSREIGFLSMGVTSWEEAQGLCKRSELYDYYDLPSDRDAARDVTDGKLGLGSAQAENFMSFRRMLSFYCKQHDYKQLVAAPDGQLKQLEALVRHDLEDENKDKNEAPGVLRGDWIEKFPAFMPKLKADMQYPLARRHNPEQPFDLWQTNARAEVKKCYQYFKPAVDFDPVLVCQEDRGSYTAQKILLNISAYSRVSAYLLIPKGRGPFPGMLVLHDHGAKFDIGKEKMVRPLAPADPRMIKSSQDWVDACYGGSYIGDELAKRGYVCFCTDALNWSERSVDQDYLYSLDYIGKHGNDTHILDHNMQWLGASLAGWIAQEDQAAAEFMATLPYVDKARIGSIGLSMGAYRSWQVAAMSPHISASVAICWMCQCKWLIQNGVNHAGGNNNWALHPGLYSKLDIPDYAALAAPKPLLMYGGLKDVLFPVPSVRASYHIIENVYKELGAEKNFVHELWDVPHEYNLRMQEKSMNWLDGILKP